MLLAKEHPVSIMYLLSHQTPLIDFSYTILPVSLCHTAGRCYCQIPYYADILIGIVVNPAVCAVNVEIINWTRHLPKTFSYVEEELHLLEYTNVYTHTTDEVIENHKTGLFQSKFSTGSVKVWELPKITPFFMSKASVSITLDFLITSHIDKIELLYLFMNPDMCDSIYLKPYKGMVYEDCAFFRKSDNVG